MKEIFKNVYPFTTENIAGYIERLDLKDKSVLTVGSSGDQAFNALLLGANRIVLYDINPNTYGFLKLKKDLILDSKREELYDRVINEPSIPQTEELFSEIDLQHMNLYLKDDESYQKLKKLLEKKNIEFIEGDIFEMDKSLGNETFDRMIFSNILQYIDIFAKEKGYEGRTGEFLRERFKQWDSHLTEDGIIQLIYYYGLMVSIGNYMNLENTLEDYQLILRPIPDFQNSSRDGFVTYQKVRR